MKRKRHVAGGGFTLIEVLVVIAIVSLLVAILLPSLSKARETARRSACLSNLHQCHVAAVTYANEYGLWYPAPAARTDNPNIPWGNAGCMQNLAYPRYFNVNNNWTGWWKMLNGTGQTFMRQNGARCPSMDIHTYHGSFNSGYMVDYDYRFNNRDPGFYGMYPGSTYQQTTFERSPQWIPLFLEGAGYRLLPGDVAPRPMSTTGFAFKWAHTEGGNLIRMDGAGRWLATDILPAYAGFYGNAPSWPSNGVYSFYYYGGKGMDTRTKAR